MGKRTSYAPGTFSWVDLATTDADAAKSFYAGVFGWEMADEDAGDGAVYTMCRVDGDAVCGIFGMTEDMRAAGVQPSWTSYVTVADADAAAGRANELGGSVVRGPFDVLDAGRMAVLKDSRGVVFAAWQPRARIGAERVNDAGCLCMNELVTSDTEAASSFYGDLFGWTTVVPDELPDGIAMVLNDGNINASVITVPEGNASYWRPCFTVASTEGALERVRELGGEQQSEVLDIGHGSLLTARDPQGAVFSLFAGEVDP